MQPSREKISTLAVITAGVCWGIISFFVRQLSTLGFDSFQIMCIRAWLSATLLLIYLLIFKRDLLKISVRDIWMFVGTGMSAGAFLLGLGAGVGYVLILAALIILSLPQKDAASTGETLTDGSGAGNTEADA